MEDTEPLGSNEGVGYKFLVLLGKKGGIPYLALNSLEKIFKSSCSLITLQVGHTIFFFSFRFLFFS